MSKTISQIGINMNDSDKPLNLIQRRSPPMYDPGYIYNSYILVDRITDDRIEISSHLTNCRDSFLLEVYKKFSSGETEVLIGLIQGPNRIFPDDPTPSDRGLEFVKNVTLQLPDEDNTYICRIFRVTIAQYKTPAYFWLLTHKIRNFLCCFEKTDLSDGRDKYMRGYYQFVRHVSYMDTPKEIKFDKSLISSSFYAISSPLGIVNVLNDFIYSCVGEILVRPSSHGIKIDKRVLSHIVQYYGDFVVCGVPVHKAVPKLINLVEQPL